ncbi:MAG: TetR/AcrR family transcriptional regulator [Alphaproteobacteria bacterium]|nr:TetR/AcrR family transcriptional regulator [Alphaproteobacteria bacterium]
MPRAKPIPQAAERVVERWALPARQDRSRAMRTRILKAAEAAFAEQGYDGARIADIAKAAGCSVGAVYFRFKDKDALFFAIAESFAEDARARLADLFDGVGQPPAQMIREFVRRTAVNYRAHKGLFRAIVERGFDHPLAMKTMMAFRDELAGALERSLRAHLKARRAGELPLALRVATQMIYGFFLTGVLNAQAPTRIADARAVEEVAGAVIAYFESKGLLA